MAAGSQLTISGGSLTIVNPSTVDGVLSLSGGTLILTGGLTVSQQMNWSTGTVSGTGGLTIAANATLNINVPGVAAAALSGATLTNLGAVIETANNNVNCAFQVLQLGMINNAGSWTLSNDVLVQADSTAVGFNNTGSLVKSGGTATSTWSVPLSGSGQINIASGTMNLNGKPTGNITGPIAVQGGATLLYGQGGTLAGGQVTGTGTLTFTAGVTINGSYTFSGRTQIQSGGGTVAINGTTNIANLNLINGTLSGTGAVTINATMNWTGGTIGGSGLLTINNLILAANATVNIDLNGPLLSVVGNLTLASSLNLISPSGFSPSVGSIVGLFSFSNGFSGGFNAIGGLGLANGDILEAELTDAGLSFLVAKP